MLPQLGDAFAVDLRHTSLYLAVVDEQKSPVLGIAPARCPHRGVEDQCLDLLRDRGVLHPAHRSCRVERFEAVHLLHILRVEA